jgi:hypothetical protein
VFKIPVHDEQHVLATQRNMDSRKVDGWCLDTSPDVDRRHVDAWGLERRHLGA